MELRHRRLHHVDVLSIRGHVRAPEAVKLRERINQLFDEGRFCLVLDLEHLESIGSTGLYVLIEAHARARKVTCQSQGCIRIIRVGPRIRRVLDLTGLTSMLHIYDDLDDAVNSLSGCPDQRVRTAEHELMRPERIGARTRYPGST